MRPGRDALDSQFPIFGFCIAQDLVNRNTLGHPAASCSLRMTNESDILNAERIVGRKLIPQFSYTSSTRYQHPSYNQYVR